MTPRGLSNNNPGNVEKTKPGGQPWNGEVIPSKDPRFAQFLDVAHGYRVIFKLINTYVHKLGKSTVQDIINQWAPPVENNTSGYVSRVCHDTGLQPTSIVDTNNQDIMVKIVAAISAVEEGQPAIMSDVVAGWNLYIHG